MTNERRRNLRIPVRVTVILKDTTFDGTLYFTSSNLSSGGMFLEADILLQEGSIVSLQFSLPESTSPVRAVAKVARVVEKRQDVDTSGLGLEFLEMDLASRELLHTFVDRQTDN